MSEPAFWQDLYDRGGDGWQLDGPAPALVDVLDTAPPPTGRVAVPGCGRGHDVRVLAARGYDVIGFDFAPSALADAQALAHRDGVVAAFEPRDVFSLAADHAGAFDGVWEYTCFCAIDPGRRAEYADVIATILRPGGWLLACFYPMRAGGGGPPFPVSHAEISELFGGRLQVESLARPRRSPPNRAGEEVLMLARKPVPGGRASAGS